MAASAGYGLMAALRKECMELLSVNVGLPREVRWRGLTVTTGIYKAPVAGRVALLKLNLDGDRQADLTVHGGEHKAVYCYPAEHYEYWKREIGTEDLGMAAFGENFTSRGLVEDSVHLGDRFAIGTAEVVVTQPRMPCYKLEIKFDSTTMARRFLLSGRSGFYFGVAREGEVGAGDEIREVAHDESAISIAEVNRLYVAKSLDERDRELVRRMQKVEAFPEAWKAYFREKVAG